MCRAAVSTTGETGFAVRAIGRQRGLYARQRLCRACTHGIVCTAKSSTAKLPLPCAWTDCTATPFAVRRHLCRALRTLPCEASLPCVAIAAVRRCFAVRPSSLPCALRCRAQQCLPCGLALSRTAKNHAGTPPRSSQEHSWATRGPFAVRVHTAKRPNVLCRVHTHGKGAWFFHFFAIFQLSLHFKYCISQI
jgi:hypothetical protein